MVYVLAFWGFMFCLGALIFILSLRSARRVEHYDISSRDIVRLMQLVEGDGALSERVVVPEEGEDA